VVPAPDSGRAQNVVTTTATTVLRVAEAQVMKDAMQSNSEASPEEIEELISAKREEKLKKVLR